MWSRDHYVSQFYSNYRTRKKRSAGEKVENAAGPHTIKELAHARPALRLIGHVIIGLSLHIHSFLHPRFYSSKI